MTPLQLPLTKMAGTVRKNDSDPTVAELDKGEEDISPSRSRR